MIHWEYIIETGGDHGSEIVGATYGNFHEAAVQAVKAIVAEGWCGNEAAVRIQFTPTRMRG